MYSVTSAIQTMIKLQIGIVSSKNSNINLLKFSKKPTLETSSTYHLLLRCLNP